MEVEASPSHPGKIFFYILDMATVKFLAMHRVLGCKMNQAEFKLKLVRGFLHLGKR